MTEQPHDWDRVLELYAQLKRGEALSMSNDLEDLLRRVAPTLAISSADAAAALLSSTEQPAWSERCGAVSS